MNLIFALQAWEDYVFWQKADPKMIDRINQLLKDIVRNPHVGIGKPEPLKHGFHGYWSRRITDEHRLVYKVVDDEIRIEDQRSAERQRPPAASTDAARPAEPVDAVPRTKSDQA